MSLAEGIQKAADLIDSGKALAFMERFIRLSREAAQ
jgi:anthranilate phosphoribosyltransferase